MSRTTIGVLVSLFVVAVIGLFAFWYLAAPAPEDVTVDEQVATEEEPATEEESTTRITAKHFYEDGVHTLAGEIDMPTPCDLLEYDTMVQESYPEQVTIDFTVLNNAEMCAQVITAQRFMVEVAASEDASFSATLRGEAVDLNLVPAEPGETPEEFELYIKG